MVRIRAMSTKPYRSAPSSWRARVDGGTGDKRKILLQPMISDMSGDPDFRQRVKTLVSKGCVTTAASEADAQGPRTRRGVAATLVRRVAAIAGKGESASMPDLTRRQARVFALITDGLSNKEIARALGIEVATVKNHVHQLLRKLNVTRRSAAATVARRQGVGGNVQRVVFGFAWAVPAASQIV
jgi:DNA-binding CsgD family transcriptional regulator